ncbi:NAD-dependent epimerase/dehydratase family protein [Frondihabitans australicus]|uniref:Nucleoside-diphosphate-sugar epimerase n=1 Tax=Frondihabitans australicus TaxID=386892 RepID=A0A495ILD1_9MICO|nr:NAD-dependent epimerase/dehydratase family protein [Frondihabitans australicus]RKR75966.1 nucleoside-diphosphate-sugar epimerase [Frondihabitans australicus]
MRVLVTGPAGHIGQAVLAELIGHGHEVTGLVRSESSAAAVEKLGATALHGDVNDLSLLASAAADVDAVIHLAFDHGSVAQGDMQTAVDADTAVVNAFGDALAGTGKTFIGIGIARTGDAERDRLLEANPRVFVSRAVLELVSRDVRALLVAVPPVTHSDRDVHGFLPTIIGIAKRQGASGYIDEGLNVWPAVHTLDLAVLFRLALEKAPAGSQLIGSSDEGVEVRRIAENIAGHLGLPAVSVPAAEAPAFFAPFIFMGMNVPMPNAATRELLGWEPTHPRLIEDLDAGHYFTR